MAISKAGVAAGGCMPYGTGGKASTYGQGGSPSQINGQKALAQAGTTAATPPSEAARTSTDTGRDRITDFRSRFE